MKAIGLSLLFFTSVAAAEEVPLGLDAALEQAKANSARLAQLAALEDAADAGVRGARAERWPAPSRTRRRR